MRGPTKKNYQLYFNCIKHKLFYMNKINRVDCVDMPPSPPCQTYLYIIIRNARDLAKMRAQKNHKVGFYYSVTLLCCFTPTLTQRTYFRHVEWLKFV